MRVCCNHPDSVEKFGQNSVKSPDSSWPSDSASSLRVAMADGVPLSEIKDCAICLNQERIGLQSLRVAMLRRFQNTSGITTQALIDNPKITTIDLQFGHLCNLSCVMCHPAVSSHLHATRTKMAKVTPSDKQREFYESQMSWLTDNSDWTTNDDAFNRVLDLCKDATDIKIGGGEPFLNPRFKEFLAFIVNKEVPVRLISLVTNGTIYDQEIVDLLNRINRVSLRISFESIGKEDEFIRWPTKWDEKEKNIHLWWQNLRGIQNAEKLMNTCIQTLNLFSIEESRKWVTSLPYNVRSLCNVLGKHDRASMWNADPDYIEHYLSTVSEVNEHNQIVVNHAKEVLGYKNRYVKQHTQYMIDFAKVQGKDMREEFPLWYKYHEKYIMG